MTRRIGVTGTDTGVGKTVVSVAILAMLRERGLRVAGMKPVETGARRGTAETDAARLREAAGGHDADELVCPFVFPEPLAPWIAARRAGAEIDLGTLDRAFAALRSERDVVLVEGAGGLLVPLTRDVAFDTLFQRWNVGVIVVAADRLGVLNHARLTVAAVLSAGLEVRGLVLNTGHRPPGYPGSAEESQGPARETNEEALVELLPGIPVVRFPRLADPGDLPAAAEAARRCGLEALLGMGVTKPGPAHPLNLEKR